MTVPLARRPWSRRKRTWAAAAAWLVSPPLYVLSEGPAIYATNRGWLPVPAYRAVYGPLLHLMRLPGNETRASYNQWWLDLAYAQEFGDR